MRSPLLLSILMAATLGACDQTLTHDMTGTGGTAIATGGWSGTATGGSGGITLGTGGIGASDGGSICNTLVSEYQWALDAAQTCQVGAVGQCQQLASLALEGCYCSTYVTDSSALDEISSAWQAAGCQNPTGPCNVFCPAALNTTCVSADGGSLGYCSYVPGSGGTGGGTGGTSGAGGSPVDGGLPSCAILESEYADVLNGALTCTPGLSGQCGQQVPASLSGCSCNMEFVTDSSILDGILQQWTAAGCGTALGTSCPLEACGPVSSNTSACVLGDAAGYVCVTRSLPLPTTTN